jgi:hypothetical protein
VGSSIPDGRSYRAGEEDHREKRGRERAISKSAWQEWSFANNDELVRPEFFDFEIAQYEPTTFIRRNNNVALIKNVASSLCVRFISKGSSTLRIAPKSKVYVYSVRIISPIVYLGFPHHRCRILVTLFSALVFAVFAFFELVNCFRMIAGHFLDVFFGGFVRTRRPGAHRISHTSQEKLPRTAEASAAGREWRSSTSVVEYPFASLGGHGRNHVEMSTRVGTGRRTVLICEEVGEQAYLDRAYFEELPGEKTDDPCH